MIQASIKIAGRLYESSATTIVEVIKNLPVGNAKGRGILSLTRGENTKIKVIPLQRVVQLFGTVSDQTKAIALKQVSALFDKTLFET